jgi:hypothetical protein
MPRLFTVVIVTCEGMRIPSRETVTYYQADFAGVHFARDNINDVKHWVRIAARNAYGRDTQIIFLTESERN